jgi:predicted flap endonuclease-1-like 5' DNA nuclease
MANKTAMKNKETRVENIKSTVKEINKQAVNFTDGLVDETLATGAEWQKVFAKALKTGTTLLDKQQEMTFETLESVKGQILKGGYRFRKLFSLETPKRKTVEKKAPKTAKKAVEALDAKTRVSKVAEKVAEVDAKVKTVKKAGTKKVVAKKTVTKKTVAKKTVEKSDLKVIDGVGPKLESILNDGGIFTFDQLATAKFETVKGILEAAGPRYKMHDPNTWAAQAKLAAAGKMDELEALQTKLKANK